MSPITLITTNVSVGWLIYAVLGFGSIMASLLWTKHAKFYFQSRSPLLYIECWDERETGKHGSHLGGAASFTCGLLYASLTLCFPNGWYTRLFATYAVFQFGLTIVQLFPLAAQLILRRQHQYDSIELKAHLDGCGYTTAWSPLWPLFLIQKIVELIPSAKSAIPVIVGFRDLLTRLDYLFSLPAIVVINILTFVTLQIWFKPIIDHVDNPHPHA